MATTGSPWNIPLVDGATIVQPIQTPFNAQANALHTALNTVDARIDTKVDAGTTLYIGTAADRAAMSGSSLRNGIEFNETDTGVKRRRNAAAWSRVAQPYAVATGTVAVAGTGATTVTFPTGLFTQPPIVQCSVISVAGLVYVPHRSEAATTTGFNVRIYGLDGQQSAGTIEWTAIQATAAGPGGA
ncbi:hypothetical protein [Microbacterium sp.]|uniref:hypothetical protein n=1 Tax=Microbacterium sp. TaxID=51671 RepID=UPI0039E5B598